MARKTFSDIKGEVQKATEPSRPPGSCAAYGCPLRGTLFGGAQSSDGWCYLHDAHRESQDLPTLTRAINMRRRLFDAVHALYADVDQVSFWIGIPGRYAKPFRELQREDLLPTAEERKKTRQAWLGRARRDLEAEVLAELGVTIKRGAPKGDDDRRTYAPTEEDIEAARLAEQAIANGTWRKPGDALGMAA